MSEKDNNQHRAWIKQLSDYQTSDFDQREQAREADYFILDKDGQWELHVSKTLDSQKRPRYTLDKCTPALESIMGDIEEMDFSVNVKPQGRGANKALALLREGLIRTIENESRAVNIYRNVARRIIRRGFDAIEIKAKYVDEWSFEQDIIITSIPNAINRVWFDNTSTEQDGSDIQNAYVLTSMSMCDYKEQWPKGSGVSVSDADTHQQYEENYQPEVITVGKKYYRKSNRAEVLQMSNGEVIENNEENQKTIKLLTENYGIFIKNRKMVDNFKVYCRYFDGSGFLEKEQETVFTSIPIVPFYGNHEILGHNSKLTYSGIILKLMDAQRIHNYATSREVEEGALAPRTKFWMTKKQAVGHTKELATMNINSNPVQFYNHDDQAPAPYQSGANQVNPHLSMISAQMAQNISQQASVSDSMKGDLPTRASEDAIRQLISRGQASTRKWVNSLTIGIARVGHIINEAIPVVYDTKRELQITGIDGIEAQEIVNHTLFDTQTKQPVINNDLNQGKYKITCEAGPAFSNRQEAGLNALLEYAKVDPSIVQIGGDIMLKSMNAPLVDKISERKRDQMLEAGLIPPEQMTPEEQQKMQQQAQQQAQQAQANQQNDPNTILAEAERLKGQAELVKQQREVGKLQLESGKLQLDVERMQNEKVKLSQDLQNSHMDNMGKAADIDKTVADTAQSWAKTDELQGNARSKQIENLEKITPQVTIVAHNDQ